VSWLATLRKALNLVLLEFGCVLEDAGYEDFYPSELFH